MEQGQTAFYKVLYEIAKEVNSSLAVQEVLDAIVASITKAIDAKGCSLMLLTPNREQLVHSVAYGLSDWYIRKGPIKAVSFLQEVLQGKPVVILNAPEDPRVYYPEQARREGIASILCMPLRLRDEVIGVLTVYTAEPRHFSSGEIDFLSAVANLGAIALEKARVYESLGEEYERRLQEKADELARLEQGKGYLLRFLSIAAHDLKAPLAAIQSYFGVMLGGFAGELAPKPRQMIKRSSQRIVELLELISDLLDVSRIETGQIVQEMEEVSVAQAAGKAFEGIEDIAEQRRVKLTTDIPEELPLVYASPDRLQQVFTNLLGNAVKFTPEGGSICLKLRKDYDEVKVEVSDTGIGVPSEDLAKIFDDFYRGSNVKTPGTGLGLSIVKRIVEAHRGRIWAESPCPETGTGTKFTFTIPIKTVEMGEEQ